MNCCWRRARGWLTREEQPAEPLLAVVLVAAVTPARPVVVAAVALLHRRRRRWGRGLDEPVLHLSQRLELAEVEEDAAARIALLEVDAVALVGLHDARALRTQQCVAGAGRRWGLGWFVWRDAHISITLDEPGKCL